MKTTTRTKTVKTFHLSQYDIEDILIQYIRDLAGVVDSEVNFSEGFGQSWSADISITTEES